MSTRYYEVQLLRKFVCDSESGRVIYRKGSWQYAWQDRHGFIWLRGKRTGWEFASVSKPGVDFTWPYGQDPPEEIANAREVAAIVGPGEDDKANAYIIREVMNS